MSIYLWEFPDNYPPSLIGEYCNNSDLDRFVYKKGLPVPKEIKPATINFEKATLSRLRKLGVLASNIMVPIIDKEVRDILFSEFEKDVEFCPVVIRCRDGESNDFFIINIINSVNGIDHDKSEYSLVPGTDKIMSFRSLFYRDDCLGSHNLARDNEYLSHLLVSKKVRDCLSDLNKSGIAFYLPEEK